MTLQERNRAYYLAHREQLLAKATQYRSENRDRIRTWFREYDHTPERAERRKLNTRRHAAKHRVRQLARYHKNREAISAQRKRDYQRRRDTILAKANSYYQRNSEKVIVRNIAYAKSHKELYAAIRARYIHQKRSTSDGTLTTAQVKKLYAEVTACPYCDVPLDRSNRHLDHKEPLSRGGRHTLGNVIPCCKTCNVRKGAKPYAVWLASLQVPCAV